MRVEMLILIGLILASGQSFSQMGKEQTLDNASATALGADLSAGLAAPTNTSLGYIWSVTGIELGPVIMALYQEGSDLYGAAKYEPDSGPAWNAVVIGRAEGDRVDLTITALQGEAPVSSRLNGTFDHASQSINGEFFQVSDGRITKRGGFQAIWVNPDTSSYAPAKIVPTGPAAPASSEPGNLSASQTLPTGSQTQAEPAAQASRFHDVHQDADRILTGVGDISQIPIGMGGSGLA